MKDLTDYFGKTDGPNLESLNDKTSSKICEDELKAEKMDNSNNFQNKRNKRKKKLKRKPSDPAVKNIVDMLSNSLTIVSPNTSCNSQSKLNEEKEASEIFNDDKISIISDEERDNILLKDEISQKDTVDTNRGKENSDCSKLKKQVNAFQFMMESRNKIIGQNSPGKDWSSCDDDTMCEKKKSKDVLAARKNLLQNWSNKKGASKRKREEEEIEETISYKLQNRAKRLRKLLQADDPKDVRSSVVKRVKKRIKRISSSSSENSKNSVLLEDVNETLTNPSVEVIEENAEDSVFNQSKTKEVKQGLLTFFGVVQKTKESPIISKQIENNIDQELITKKQETRKLKKKKKQKSDSGVSQIIDEPLEIIIDEENSNDLSVVKESKSKRRKQHVDKKSEKCVLEETKTSKTPTRKVKDDDNFTPRSLKSWKMKIKINENHADKELVEVKTEEKRSQRASKINYSLLILDESSNESEYF